MKLITRVVLLLAISLIVLTFVISNNFAQPVVTVPGIYESFTVGKGSGDLEGMRVVILPAGGGYYAMVQIAQGGAEDPKPELVPAEVKGRNLSFTVGEQKFSGTANAAGLTLNDGTDQAQSLKRKPCSSFFR
jgi:hypothetical protein